MSYNPINTQTLRAAARKDARRRRKRVSVKIPLHLDPNDRSPEADAKRYDLNTTMCRLNPSGYRMVGKRGDGHNRLTLVAQNAYNL